MYIQQQPTMQTLYPTYNEDTIVYHQTALAYIATALQEIFCPKPPITHQIEQEEPEPADQPPQIEIDIHTAEQQELLNPPKPTHPINPVQATALQIICNCLAQMCKKPKQKY